LRKKEEERQRLKEKLEKEISRPWWKKNKLFNLKWGRYYEKNCCNSVVIGSVVFDGGSCGGR